MVAFVRSFIKTLTPHSHICTFPKHLHIKKNPLPYHVTHLERTPLYHMHRLIPDPSGLTAYFCEEVLWQPLCTVGLPSLEVTDEVTNGVRLFTSKLTYTLATRPAPEAQPYAYRLTLANGVQLILGLYMRPYPVATITDSHEEKATGRASCTVQVELKNAPYGPLRQLE